MSFYLEVIEDNDNVTRTEMKPSNAVQKLDSLPDNCQATIVSPSGDRWTPHEARRHFESVYVKAN